MNSRSEHPSRDMLVDSRRIGRLPEGLSPIGFAAVAVALLVYLPMPGAFLYTAAICASVASAAVAVVLLDSAAAGLRNAGSRLLLLSAGFLAGSFLLVRDNQDRASIGLPLSAVSAYEVRLTDDSLRLEAGGMLYRGCLLAVSGRDGTRVLARGTVTLTGGRDAFDWGTRLHISGAPKPGTEIGTDWRGAVSSKGMRVFGSPPWYYRLRSRCREWVAMRLQRLGGEDGALFMALFLGARDDLEEAESFFFRRAGVIHLLALSGFHLGILSVILVALLSPLAGKVRATAIAGVLLAGYLFIAGPKVSLLRALVMFVLFGGCRLGAIRSRAIDLLGLTFLISALTWPSSLRTLSFELSYLALAGILVLGAPVDRMAAAHLPRFLRLPLAASVGATIATAPVLAARFGLLYPVGLVSTLVLTPLVTAFVWTGLGCLFLPLPAPLDGAAAQLLSYLHLVLSGAAELFARMDPVRIGKPEVALLVTGCCILAIDAPPFVRWACARRRRQKPKEMLLESGRAGSFSLQSEGQMIYDSPRQLAQFLDERGLSLKKRLGQNFLISPGARERILALLDTDRERFVWEIGGGIGSLTHHLAGTFERVAVFEIDHGFVRVLEESFGRQPGIEVVEGDFLKSWPEALRRFGRPDAIVGNLPYRSAAPIIASLVEWEQPVSKAIFTVQREVARRIAARPGSKEQSSFSLLCQSLFEVRLHGDIAPRSFFPVPQVVSSIVSLVPGAFPRDYDRSLFAQVVRNLFASRRKTVRNNLLSGAIGTRFGSAQIDLALRSASIDPGDRGERLSVGQVIELVAALSASPPASAAETDSGASSSL